MTAFEDKVAQRAVVMLMGAVYEQDFKSFSYAFRKNHSPHQALSELREKCMGLGINWIVDVKGFFDNLDHNWMLAMVKRRINDGAMLRLIGKLARNALADSENGTFVFLGFTHYWTRSLRGYWVIKRKTAMKRVRRTMKTLWIWCRNNRHMRLKEQHQELCQKLRGHYQYYGIRCNYKMLEVVMEHAEKAWRFWLSRRSHKSAIPWDKFKRLIELFPLPMPRIIHDV